MQFKDLPEDIQKIAADTLKAHLSTLDLIKEPKANLENISRNVRDVFVGLYACIDEYQQRYKTEQKTDPFVFWNTVEAIARSKMFEFNSINHSGIDTHQSSHRDEVSMLLAMLQEQGECPLPTSNNTEQLVTSTAKTDISMSP